MLRYVTLSLSRFSVNFAQTHPLLESLHDEHEVVDDAESIGLVASKAPRVEFDEDDPDLGPLLLQLQSHLETIKTNTQQIPAIEREMLRTRAALTKVST